MKKSLPIWVKLTMVHFVPTYPISLGKLGLRFFLRHEPPRPHKIFFSAVFFSKIFPRPEATLAIFLWIFAFFQLCPTWVFLKTCPNLDNVTLYEKSTHMTHEIKQCNDTLCDLQNPACNTHAHQTCLIGLLQ